MQVFDHQFSGAAQALPAAPVHRNNFDALRVAAAVLVLFSHQFSLMGLPQPFAILGRTVGEVAVEVFFTISGYLITQSWLADPNVVRFAAKRLLRVYPGLVVVLLISAILLGAALTSVDLMSYFSSPVTWRYVSSNLAMHIVYTLPGVFAGNPSIDAVNGSLWTLPYELRWYLYLLIFGMLGLIRHFVFVAFLWCVMFFHYFFFYNLDAALLAHGDHRWAEELGLFFVAGMLLLVTKPCWQRAPLRLLVLALCISTILLVTGRPNAALAVAVPILTILAGTARSWWLARATMLGDLSYGIYIYAFLVQQTVLHFFGERLGVMLTMMICLVITVLLAIFSWHCVEKHALHFKRWFPRPRMVPTSAI